MSHHFSGDFMALSYSWFPENYESTKGGFQIYVGLQEGTRMTIMIFAKPQLL